VPNPPFKINIHTTSLKKVRDEHSFKKVTSSSLRDYSWKVDENIRIFEISLDKKKSGIIGSVTVALLESHKVPVNKIELNSRDINIEGDTYTLERNISIFENSIQETSKSITINDNGEIKLSDSTTDFARSKSRISLHGIEIPTTLFPYSWDMKKNQVKISWPLPLIIVVDIYGKRDLDLNSSRTQILLTEKWLIFEEELAFQIFSKIASSVSITYWKKLKLLLVNSTKNDSFLKGINRVHKLGSSKVKRSRI
jgi:hypothetical protein